MPALSFETRIAIQHLHRAGIPHRRIAKEYGLNLTTVKRWAARVDNTGSVALGKSPGRPRLMSPAACQRAQDLLISGSSGGARFVANILFSEGLTPVRVAPCTVIRAVKRWVADKGDALVCLRGRPPKVMTPRTREKRLQFTAKNLNRPWKHVMITDRCRFYFRFPGSRVSRTRWALRSLKHAEGVFTPNKPMCYNVYGGITRYGVTKLHVVTGTTGHKSTYCNQQGRVARNITKGEYRDVVKSTLLKEGRRIFAGQGMPAFVLQQDNDPCHSAAKSVVAEWNESRRNGVVQILDGWPGNSPDLSPIENVWAWVDAEVAAMGCKTFPEFCEAIDMKFKNVPKSMLANLFDSLPKRMQQCLTVHGHKTSY